MATGINKYNTSIIYTLRSYKTNKYYIGATTQTLSQVKADYTRRYINFINGTNQSTREKTSSFEIVKYGDAYIELLESVNCNNRSELNKRTGELIREHINNVVNTELFKPVKEKYNVLTDDEWKPKLFHNSYGDWKTCKCKKSYRVESEKQHMSSKEHIDKINGTYVGAIPITYPLTPRETDTNFRSYSTNGIRNSFSGKGFSNS